MGNLLPYATFGHAVAGLLFRRATGSCLTFDFERDLANVKMKRRVQV